MRHKCSLTSIKLCNTAHQRAEFLVIQKCSSCVLPNPVLGARLGELVLDGCPRILYPDQLQFTAFPPAPSPRPAVYPGQVVGCFGLECCDLQVCPSCHPVVLSAGACHVTPAVQLYPGATSPCLHLPALELFRHLGFAVPPGLMLSCFPCVSQLWVWCLQ